MIEKELKIESLFNSSLDAMILIDPTNQEILDVNAATKDILGYDRGALLGKSFLTILPKHSKTEEEDFLDQTQLSGPVIENQEFVKADGSRGKLDLTSTVIEWGKKDVILATLRDVDRRNNHNTQAGSNEKGTPLESLSKGLANELEHPLGLIIGFAQSSIPLMKGNDLAKKNVLAIEREAIRCKGLIQDLLVFSDPEPDETNVFELGQTLWSVLGLVEKQTRQHDIQMNVDLAPSFIPIQGNKFQFQQMVLNLCRNAIEGMPKGGDLTIRTKTNTDDGQLSAILEVSDTGKGMSDEIQQRMFDPYFTTKNSNMHKGLGLTFIYETVRMFSGSIECKSNVDQGTTFYISLPLPTKIVVPPSLDLA